MKLIIYNLQGIRNEFFKKISYFILIFSFSLHSNGQDFFHEQKALFIILHLFL